MNLNNLKPAWKQFVLFNSMQSVDANKILSVIDQADHPATGRLPRLVTNVVMFVMLIICSGG